jgi:hypothetical protein
MLDQIKRVDGVRSFPPAQLVEQRRTVRPEHNRLAVDRKALGFDPPGSSSDRRQFCGLVNGVAAVKPDGGTVPADDQPIVLDFVNPIGTGGRF